MKESVQEVFTIRQKYACGKSGLNSRFLFFLIIDRIKIEYSSEKGFIQESFEKINLKQQFRMTIFFLSSNEHNLYELCTFTSVSVHILAVTLMSAVCVSSMYLRLQTILVHHCLVQVYNIFLSFNIANILSFLVIITDIYVCVH